jgi:hydroxyacyl-ACP dehydratase HTD2-like protein with hotdog domain
MNGHQGDMDWKSYLEDMRTMYAEGRADTHQRKVAPQELDCTDAVKEVCIIGSLTMFTSIDAC